MTREKLNFEDSLVKLERIVKRLESNDIPLEEAINAYEESQAIIANCETLLAEAEKKIKKLVKKTDPESGSDEFQLELL